MKKYKYKVLNALIARQIFICLCIVCGAVRLAAQPFPVNAGIMVIPPSGVSLAEYQQTLVPKIQATLLLADLTKPQFNVRLRLTITGQGIILRTKTGFLGSPIALFPGQTIFLDQAQLSPYLDFNNMTIEGLDRGVFINRGLRLPEGTYNFCLEAFDYKRPDGLPVSNFACALTMLQEYDPPLLMVPDFTNTILFEDQPPAYQQALFTWHPMHIGVFPVEYQLRIYRGLPSMDQLPDNIILTQTASYISVTTTNTFYNLGPLDPPLLPGEQYYAVVQVKPINYPAIFKNKGNSKYVIFSLSDFEEDICTSPKEYKGNNDRLGIAYRWKMSNNCTQFVTKYFSEADLVLMYKPLGFSVSESFRDTLTEVLNNTVYVLKTGCICESDTLYSDTIRIEYKRPRAQPPEFDCGSDQQMADALPVLLPVLNEGDTILANDMEVIIRKSVGGNGNFSGKGHIVIPYINYARVNVEFQNITVNDEYRMIDGEMKVKGIGQNVLSDATIEDIMNMLDALDEISDLLGNLIDILAALEELIKSLEGFLPPWIINELKAIQEAMANNPDEAELQALKDHLAEINKEKHEWELIYFNAILEGISNLQEEYSLERNTIQSDYAQRVGYFGAPAQSNGMTGMANGDGNTEEQFVLPQGMGFEVEDITWEQLAVYDPQGAEKGQALLVPEKKYAILIMLDRFEAQLDDGNVMGFVQLATNLGKNILEEIQQEFIARDWNMEVIYNDPNLEQIITVIIEDAITLMYYGL